MKRILLIEDNADLAFGLRNNLEIEGYQVLWADNGVDGVRLATGAGADLVVLDLMMPGIDGFEVISRLRKSGATAPLLVLTARGEELDKVRALRMGADDYVTKPFGLMELLARVEALLRRTAAGTSNSRITFGAVVVDSDARQVLVAGRPAELTPKEYDLLLALARRPGKAVSRTDLMREVWGHSAEIVSRTVDTHIAELRRKLEADPTRPRHIVTVRKTGYRLDP